MSGVRRLEGSESVKLGAQVEYECLQKLKHGFVHMQARANASYTYPDIIVRQESVGE